MDKKRRGVLREVECKEKDSRLFAHAGEGQTDNVKYLASSMGLSVQWHMPLFLGLLLPPTGTGILLPLAFKIFFLQHNCTHKMN